MPDRSIQEKASLAFFLCVIIVLSSLFTSLVKQLLKGIRRAKGEVARDHISFTWVINQETNKFCVKRLLALSIYHGNEPNEALYTQRTKECFCSWPWFVNGSWPVSFRDTKWKKGVRGQQGLSYSGWEQRPLGSSQRQQTFHLSYEAHFFFFKKEWFMDW